MTRELLKINQNQITFNNLEAEASTLLRINMFSATFLSEAYLPGIDSCTKYTDILQRCTKHIDFFAKLKLGLFFFQTVLGEA